MSRYYPKYERNTDYNTNAPSFYTKLAKIVESMKIMARRIEEYDDILESHIQEYKQKLDELIECTERELNKFREGGYLEQLYLDSLENWIDDNLKEIVPRIAKFVWFGLTDDGYFMAVIPENWKDVQFDTTEEGQLMLIN